MGNCSCSGTCERNCGYADTCTNFCEAGCANVCGDTCYKSGWCTNSCTSSCSGSCTVVAVKHIKLPSKTEGSHLFYIPEALASAPLVNVEDIS